MLVLLAQTLALAHRTVHPNTGVRAAVATVPDASGSALDGLFDHLDDSACDDLDAALGLDINPGQYAHATVAPDYANAAPAAPAQSPLALHPPGLSLARAPPRA